MGRPAGDSAWVGLLEDEVKPERAVAWSPPELGAS